MWGRGGRGGRHAAPTGSARRVGRPAARSPAAGERTELAEVTVATGSSGAGPSGAGPSGPPAGGERPEPVAIIGGAAIPLLAGRIRRRHTSADVESPTTELAFTLPTPRVHPSAGASPRRLHIRPLPLIALAVGAMAAVVTVGALIGAPGDPVPALPAPPIGHQRPGTDPGAKPERERVEAYLEALRSADLPASRGGAPETEAADAICAASRRGVPDSELARSLPAMLTDVDRRQAPTVVELAKRHYCP